MAAEAVLNLHLLADEDADHGGDFVELVLTHHQFDIGRKRRSLYAASSTIAIPWPTPTHMAARP